MRRRSLLVGLTIVLVTYGSLEWKRRSDAAAIRMTGGKMANVTTALSFYRQHHGHPPEDLQQLTRNAGSGMDPYIENPSMLLDAWGHPLVYRRRGERGYVLTSFGADGEPGGSWVDEDIVATNP